MRAFGICAHCISAYEIALGNALPRWGGSYEQMNKIAHLAQEKVGDNPRLATLLGAVDADRCNILNLSEQYKEAQKACDQALQHGPEMTALIERSYAKNNLGQQLSALADAQTAVDLEPTNDKALRTLALRQLDAKQYDRAAVTILAARKNGPVSEPTAWTAREVVAGVIYMARVAATEKRWPQALEWADLAVQVDPMTEDTQNFSGSAVMQWARLNGGADGLRKMIEANPDDFQAIRAFGFAVRGRGPEIVTYLNRYIERHPSDWRPYIERSRVYDAQHKKAESEADDRTACNFGSWESCTYLQKHAKQ